MTKKNIKKLVKASYLNNKLNSVRVNRVSKLLSRAELKLFIKFIKNYERSKTVILLVSSIASANTVIKQVKNNYPNKNLIIKEDSSLLGGIKIIDNDIIYDANIKNSLSGILQLVKN